MAVKRWPKNLLAAVIVGAGLSSQGAMACPTCSEVSSLGTDAQQGFQNAVQNTNTTIQEVSVGFTSSATEISRVGQEVVGAIQANARTVEAELTISREATLRLLEGLKSSIEALEQSAMVAQANKDIAETYGAENVPVSLCNAWGRIEARERATAVAEELMREHRERQLEERAEEFRTPVTEAFTAGLVPVNNAEFSEVEAQMAFEQVALLTGERSFPESPDVIALRALQPGAGTDGDQKVLSAWLRTSNASSDVARQISKRVTPTVEGENGPEPGQLSVMSDLWSAVSEGVSTDTAIEEASASSPALLRSIAHSQSVSNRIRLEQLEATLARVRISASQLGYMNERAMERAGGAGND